MTNCALIGAAGFIAPRHMRAMKDTSCNLVAAYDPNDSVGILDSYAPDCDFFIEFERFDRHIDKLRRKGIAIDFMSICSPNYLHDAHIRFALRSGAAAICEKPIVLNPWNIDGLAAIEKETGKRVYTILQLRLHPAIRALREKVLQAPPDKVWDVDLIYITSRGHWYYTSWKGDLARSGGIGTNIGVHFFDMLSWIFGKPTETQIHVHQTDVAAGVSHFERARVRWFLSINQEHLPAQVAEQGKRTYRSILIEGEELEFSEGFTDLHTESYKDIMAGGGFGLEDARCSIDSVYQIRHAVPLGLTGDYHPLCQNIRTSV